MPTGCAEPILGPTAAVVATLLFQPAFARGRCLDTKTDVIALLEQVLGLQGRSRTFTRETRLLGSLVELDSMAVASLLTALEERHGFTIDDDEIDGAAFVTVGSLADFVSRKLAG